MANFKTASGVEINDMERVLVQEIADSIIPERSAYTRRAFQYLVSEKLGINIYDAQVFTLC